MERQKHPNKEIEKTLQYAEEHGWIIEKSKGSAHCRGQILCPKNNSACRNGIYCRQSVWSTPKVPENHAKALKRIIHKCQFLGGSNE